MILKYSESFSKRKKFSSYFYVVVACCLLIIGGASWFAVSSFKSEPEPKVSEPEYTDKTPSYTESEEKREEPLEETAEPVESEPYTSNEDTYEEPIVVAFSMPVEGEIIKDYSQTSLQYSATYGDMRIHTGIDIACKEGTAVSSCADGEVLSIEDSATLGTVVTIDHKNGIIIKYASLKDIKVEAGQRVSVGDIIASSGAVPSECNDKEHIHIEVYKDSAPVSPMEILKLN